MLSAGWVASYSILLAGWVASYSILGCLELCFEGRLSSRPRSSHPGEKEEGGDEEEEVGEQEEKY